MGMSALDVARELGMSKAMVLLIERRALAKLAVALGFDRSELGDSVRRYIRACGSCGKLAIATGFPKEMGRHRDCWGCAARRRAERRRHG